MESAFELRIPSKIILSGEFSCIFGHSVITCPIPLFLNLSVEIRPRTQLNNIIVLNNVYQNFEFNFDETQKEIEGLLESNMPYFQFKKTFCELAKFLKVGDRISDIDISLKYDTKILIGMGLGSSASFILSLYYLFANIRRIYGEQFSDDINEENFVFLTNLENLFHGKSSGIDLLSILSGQIGMYERHDGVWKMKNALHTLQKPLKLLLINSKQRKNTKESVNHLLDSLQKCPEIHSQLEAISLLTKSIFDGLQQGNYGGDIQEKLAQNHAQLKSLKLSSDALDAICDVFAKHGLGCKMTGGGRGGFCLAIYDDSQKDKFELSLRELEDNGFEWFEYSISEPPKIQTVFKGDF